MVWPSDSSVSVPPSIQAVPGSKSMVLKPEKLPPRSRLPACVPPANSSRLLLNTSTGTDVWLTMVSWPLA